MPADAAPSRARFPAIVAALCFLYVVSMFLRGSVAVFAPDLARELHLRADGLGVLASTYFLAFALAQIPVGVAIDRFGARATLVASAALAVAGCLAFAWSTTTEGLTASRALIGLGCASVFVGALTVYSRWVPAARFSSVTGVQLGVGTLGAIAATAPFGWLIAAVGWRTSFVMVAAAAALAGLVVAIVVRDAPGPRAPTEGRGLAAALAGVGEAARTPSAVRLMLMQFASYPAFATVATLWGGPWLADVYGLDLGRRGAMLLLLTAAQAVGLFAWGPVDRLVGGYRAPVLFGAGASVALLAVAASGTIPPALLPAWIVAFGLAMAYLPVMTAHGRALFPPRLVGRGVTFINVGTMAGAFLLQVGAGGLIAAFPSHLVDGRAAYPVEAYRAMFAMLALVLVVAATVYYGAREPARD